MIYKKFRIRNFKGIKDTTVDLSDNAASSVFAFVGLNESGKTTILEAIHSFSPEASTSELVGGDRESGVPFKERVPRHLISSFTGNVSVTATVSVDADEKDFIRSYLADRGLEIHPDDIKGELSLERTQSFLGGDFQNHRLNLIDEIRVKGKRQKKWRTPTDEENKQLTRSVYRLTPDVAYFPTFVFNFPAEIHLTENRGGVVNAFYRRVLQDILDYDGQGLTIQKSIVERIRSPDMNFPFAKFLSIWMGHDSNEKIQHVLDRASEAVTRVVFGRWNRIFREDAKGKEIAITHHLHEGEVIDKTGVRTKTQDHDIAVKFQVKDGTRRFDINSRSLGFRWFFSFMLFTQFRVAREDSPPILFLFDEPASNLHSAAQQKLIESFPTIATRPNALAYTTHSHYMIEPKWLDQTFIVTNRLDSPSDSVIDAASFNDEALDVRVNRYRAFVANHDNKTSYFQPILDRLEVIPSRFDFHQNSVVLEGKSDYYVLRYAMRLLGKKEFALLPGFGATTFGSLVALNVGWNLNLVFLLDGDAKGKEQKDRYVKEFGLSLNRALTLDDVVSDVKVIEDILDDEALGIISRISELRSKPSKTQIRRYFQERLASDAVEDLGEGFRKRSDRLLVELESRLQRFADA